MLQFMGSHLDWLVQPKPRWLGGNGWLLDGPEEVLQGTCGVTPSPTAQPGSPFSGCPQKTENQGQPLL